MFSSIRSASRLMSRPRSRASIFRQGPESKALRAALTARSMSAASPSATSAMTSSVAGLIVSKVLPLALLTHLPSIRSLVWSDRFVDDGARSRWPCVGLLTGAGCRSGEEALRKRAIGSS